ncbi:KH domain-containing protein [Kiritimatiellaeota bacterium B1221]|nr:KH domain-containing protein [Kiritimatiellaeota bacterium B1221]
MEKMLLNILRALVQTPEDLNLKEIKGANCSFIEIRCAATDVGSIIGKNGKTISAIRVLINAITRGEGKIVIEVIEPDS